MRDDTPKTKKLSQAMTFIILFGIVSLFSDMTHEGTSSILLRGAGRSPRDHRRSSADNEASFPRFGAAR